jgi:hypothetical protein
LAAWKAGVTARRIGRPPRGPKGFMANGGSGFVRPAALFAAAKKVKNNTD